MDKLLITCDVLNKLGFSEYWDEDCTWGGRTLMFSNGVRFRIVEQEEMDSDAEDYTDNGKYIAHHYYFAEWFAIPKMGGNRISNLFFLHEMYECIKTYYPICVKEFINKCHSVKMKVYIDEYISECEKQCNCTIGHR